MPDTMATSTKRTLIGWGILLAPLAVMVILFLIPLVVTFVFSVSQYDFFTSSISFVGLNNFKSLFEDNTFRYSLQTTFYWPLFYLQLALVIATPLALSFLLLKVQSGKRTAIQAIMSLIVIFSGPVVTVLFYRIYFGEIVYLLSGPPGTISTIPFYSTQEFTSIFGTFHNVFLSNALAFSLLFGTPLFLAAIRGLETIELGTQRFQKELLARYWPVGAAFAIGMFGFNLLNLEGTWLMLLQFGNRPSLIEYSIRYLRNFHFATGSSSMLLMILPLLVLGLGLMLLLEGKQFKVSIRFFTPFPGKYGLGEQHKKKRISNVLVTTVVIIIIVIIGLLFFVLPWAGTVMGFGHGPEGPDPIFDCDRPGIEVLPGALPILQYWFLSSLGKSVLISSITLVLTAAAGFAIGYLRPKGAKAVLICFGVVTFISPAVLLGAYNWGAAKFDFLESGIMALMPYLFSPLGAILFTWLFRSIRDERESLGASGFVIERSAFFRRVLGLFSRFALPVFALYLLFFMNAISVPEVLGGKYQWRPYDLLTMACLDCCGFEISFDAAVTLFNSLQYLLPLILLVISAIFVFPRLALIIRRKGDAAQALDPAVIEKLKGE